MALFSLLSARSILAQEFVRGDSDANGAIVLTDSVFTLKHLFFESDTPPCLDAADTNDDGELDLTDAVAGLRFLFSGTGPLPPPSGVLGTDPTEDDLDCGPEEPFTPVAFQEITMCVDLVTMGGTLRVVINSQAEYDDLIRERFTEPLQEYWDRHYESVRNAICTPEMPDEKCEAAIRDAFYRFPPFRGTDECSHPEIDFSEFTLLGQAAHSTGCRTPLRGITVLKDPSRDLYLYRVNIRRFGNCQPLLLKNKWILIPKIEPSATVQFEIVDPCSEVIICPL